MKITAPVHLSRRELADRLGLSIDTLARWKMNGYGPPSFMAGKFVRYPLESVIAWEEEQLAKEGH